MTTLMNSFKFHRLSYTKKRRIRNLVYTKKIKSTKVFIELALGWDKCVFRQIYLEYDRSNYSYRIEASFFGNKEIQLSP